MEVEKQVCRSELSKKLKELGVPQESFFYWADGEIIVRSQYNYFFNDNGKNVSWENGCGCCAGAEEIQELFSAFTVAELGEFLNIWIDSCHYKFDETEANIRAKALIELIDRGLIKVEDLK